MLQEMKVIRYRLDTDIVSLLQDGNPNVVSHIASVPAGGR